jgi:putative transposase
MQPPVLARILVIRQAHGVDHVIVFNELHLKRILTHYFENYHCWRTHVWLGMESPESRSVQPPGFGKGVECPVVGRLHHHYKRLAA